MSDYDKYNLVEHEFDDDDKCFIVVNVKTLFKIFNNSSCFVSNDSVVEVSFIMIDSLIS